MLLSGCGKREAATTPPPTAQAVIVETADVAVKTVPLTFEVVGHIEARSRVALGPLVSARIEQVLIGDGAEVAVGAELIRLDPRVYDAAFKRAQAEQLARAAQVETVALKLERSKELIATDMLSAQQAKELSNELTQAQAALKQAEAGVAQATLDLDHCVLRSPIAGRVGLVKAIAGNFVAAGSEALLEVRGMDMLELDFSLPEIALPLLRSTAGGAPLKVIANRHGDEAHTVEGQLVAFDNKIDQRTRSLAVRAVMPNAGLSFWPGEFVDIKLIAGQVADALLVPFKAVNTGPSGPYLYVVENNKASLRPVQLGSLVGDLVVIASGIAKGDRVIVSGQLGMQDGSPVHISSSQPKAKQP